jgi:hypothetical protein
MGNLKRLWNVKPVAALVITGFVVGLIALPNWRNRPERPIDVSKVSSLEELSFNPEGKWRIKLGTNEDLKDHDVYDASGRINLSRAKSILTFFRDRVTFGKPLNVDGETLSLFSLTRTADGDSDRPRVFRRNYQLYGISSTGKLVGFRDSSGLQPRGAPELLFNFGPFLQGGAAGIGKGAVTVPVKVTQKDGSLRMAKSDRTTEPQALVVVTVKTRSGKEVRGYLVKLTGDTLALPPIDQVVQNAQNGVVAETISAAHYHTQGVPNSGLPGSENQGPKGGDKVSSNQLMLPPRLIASVATS